MYRIVPESEKEHYLFSIKEDSTIGIFRNFKHVLNYFCNSTLSFIGHNRNDVERETKYRLNWDSSLYIKMGEVVTPKTYIVLDPALKVIHRDLIAESLESYQNPVKTYPWPRKKGTNRKAINHQQRNTRHFQKNTVAYLLGEKKLFPLSSSEHALRSRLYYWDADWRSQKGNSWKTHKKKHQWE